MPQHTKKSVAARKIDRTKLLLKMPEVIHVTGIGEQAMRAMMKRGEFPLPLQVGPRAIAWKMTEIAAWVETLHRNATYAPAAQNEKVPVAEQANGDRGVGEATRLEAEELSHAPLGDVKEGV